MKRHNSRATRTRLDQNSTRVSSTGDRARLEMLTSRAELGSSKLDSSSSSTQNVNDSTRAQLNSNSTHIISTLNLEVHMLHESPSGKSTVVGIMYKIGRAYSFLSMVIN